jgi:hypothetical protein
MSELDFDHLYHTHPDMHGGFNAAPLSFEEFNGLGTNQPTTVDFFEDQRVGQPLIQPTSYWAESDIGVKSEVRTSKVRAERTNLKVR